MCNLNDYMGYANVISKTYETPSSQTALAVEDFLDSVAKLGVANSSLPFLAVENLSDDQVRLKVYLAMQRPVINLPIGLHFDSYLYLENMASIAVSGDFETKMADAYQILCDFLCSENLAPTTPAFAIMSGDETLKYTIIKIGYTNELDLSQNTDLKG